MPRTPFDIHAERANQRGYHNQRDNTHSDIVSDTIIQDLWQLCPAVRSDLESGRVGYWKNRKISWGRGRVTDLIVGEPARSEMKFHRPAISPFDWRGAAADKRNKPNLEALRIVIEHKTVITAHRNRDARHDDLNNLWQEARDKPRVIVGATVMVGLAERYLNIADQLHKRYTDDEAFNREIISRVKAHDEKLFTDYRVSENKPHEIKATFDKFNTLPRRPKDRSKPGFDVLLLCPVHYDNVNPARVVRDNQFGIDVDAEYKRFLGRICSDYTAFWGGIDAGGRD